MRVLLLCLCAVLAAAEDVPTPLPTYTTTPTPTPTPLPTYTTEAPLEVYPDRQTWKAQLAAHYEANHPTVEAFGDHVAVNHHLFGIKAEVAEATNLTQEIDHWLNSGDGFPLRFSDDDGALQHAVIAPNTHVSLNPKYPENVQFHYFDKYYGDTENNTSVGRAFTKLSTIVTVDNVTALGDQWDSKLPLKVLVHGFTNTVQSPVIQQIKDAYLKTGKYNVIGVDWGKLCGLPWYHAARANVPGTGALLAKLLDKLFEAKMAEPERTHIIGHSLGAHVSGIAAKSLEHGPVARVTGLDPAGPLFWFTKPEGRLHYTDADLVDVIHTNAGLYGKSASLGHIDFYVNGGSWQPKCVDNVADACSHGRAVDMFIDSILTRGYLGVQCSHLPGNPRRSTACNSKVTATMGDGVEFKKQGTYYVDPDGFPQRRSLP